MLAAQRAGMPCITHEMGINEHYDRMSRYFGQRLEKVISLSHAIHDAMKKDGVDLPNVVVIHCGIDITRYKIDRDAGDAAAEVQHRSQARRSSASSATSASGRARRRWCGRCRIVKQKFPDVRCLLVGEPRKATATIARKLESLAREVGTTDNLIFAGFQRNAIDYMELMDVVTHTSVHPEPFGIVTLEAMSRSKPLDLDHDRRTRRGGGQRRNRFAGGRRASRTAGRRVDTTS